MFFKVITTIAVTVATFVLAAPTPDSNGEGDGIAIPLTKRSDTNTREFNATSHNANIIRGPSGTDTFERNSGTPHPFAVRQDWSSEARVDLTKYTNGIWYGTIWIGNPPKSFTVKLNSASSDLFVPASTGDESCISHTDLWDPALFESTSVDLNKDFTVAFADGRTASGKQYTDMVTIAGFTADSQTIGVATTYSSSLEASVFAPDGILGLAFPSLSEFHGQSPLFHTLFKERKLSQPVFSLTLTKTGGELYVGGMNGALYLPSTLAYTPVVYPMLWLMKIDDIQLDGKILVSDVLAIIDTGSHLIYGDSSRVWILHHLAGGGPLEGFGYYTFPCMTFPSLTFTIGGKPFVLPAKALNLGRIEHRSRSCFSGIAQGYDNPQYWSIGTLFLEQFYTVFDFNSESPQVGFAHLAV